MTTTLLLDQIKERITDSTRITEGADIVVPKLYPPTSEVTVDAAEEVLGFALPPLLRQLYLEIGNGGFGPGYGLIGVCGGAVDDPIGDVVELYQWFSALDEDDPSWQWPARLLPICHLGCAMYACVDCSEPGGAIYWWEPNPREAGDPITLFLIPVAQSLEDWLWSWIRDEEWRCPAYAASALFRWNQEHYSQQE